MGRPETVLGLCPSSLSGSALSPGQPGRMATHGLILAGSTHGSQVQTPRPQFLIQERREGLGFAHRAA
jgi:hypothetical protein